MHDVFLGICRRDIALLIKGLIKSTDLSLDKINYKLKNYNYGPDHGDKPPPITEIQLKKKNVSMYASEMLTFIKHLPLIIGNDIPKKNKYWEWFLTLRKLIDCFLARTISKCVELEIEELVFFYLRQRRELFPNEKNLPKHHYLIHYARLIKNIGPLINVWCMKFEAKHRILKSYAKNCHCKTNLPLSLALKTQIIQTFYFLRNEPPKSFEHGKSFHILVNKLEKNLIRFSQKENIYDIKIVNWLKKSFYKYETGMLVRYSSYNQMPTFLQILCIIQEGDNFFFLGNIWYSIGFDEHMHGWGIKTDNTWVKESVLDIAETKPMLKYVSEFDDVYYVIYNNF